MLSRLLIKIAILPLAILTSGLLVMVVPPANTSALSGSDFKAGRIIDDAVFNNSSAMTVAQIQTFLNAKVPWCDTNGTTLIYDSAYGDTVTRKVYSQRRGVSTPFICLKDYKQTIPAVINSGSDLCTGSISAGKKSSAHIIYDVSKACGINPQVLIVMLQKEQSLITDNWPWPRQYQIAMGYGCPDTAPCDAEYYGFFNQVYQAAQAFRRYEANPKNYNYEKYRNNYIYYNPDLSRCGGSTVYIQNQATAGLYIYTPYQPNTAALNNLYGTGNSCSAYGNRNFWRLFNDWFGSTYAYLDFKPLQTPRWMVTNTDLRKVNLRTGQIIDDVIPAGTEIYFPTKLDQNDTTYLRTQHDTDKKYEKGILISQLSEVNLTYEPLVAPRWLETKSDIQKENPITGNKLGGTIPAGTKIYFPTKVDIGNLAYLRTQHDTVNNLSQGIPLSALDETVIEYTPMLIPRWMKASVDTSDYDPVQSSYLTSLLTPADSQIFANFKVDINERTYIRNTIPTKANSLIGIPLHDLGDIDPIFSKLTKPRAFTILNDTKKYQPITQQEIDDTIVAGTIIYFTEKIDIGGTTYLRTAHDSEKEYIKGIKFTDLSEVDLTFSPLLYPRAFVLRNDTFKKDPVTGRNIDKLLKAGTVINFSTKIDTETGAYLRTEHDTTNDNYKGILLTDLKELD